MFEGIEKYVLLRQNQKIIIQRMLHHCGLSLSLSLFPCQIPGGRREYRRHMSCNTAAYDVNLQETDRQTDRQTVSRNDKNRNRTKCLAPIWMKSQVFYRCKAYWSMEPHQYISIQWFRLKLICVLITQFCFSIDLLLTYLPTCDAYCPFLLPVFLDVPQPCLSQDRLTAVKLPQEHIAKIEKWLQDKQIKANPNKCNHITFALRKQSLTVFCNSQIYLSRDKKETWQLFRKPMCSRCQWSLDM